MVPVCTLLLIVFIVVYGVVRWWKSTCAAEAEARALKTAALKSMSEEVNLLLKEEQVGRLLIELMTDHFWPVVFPSPHKPWAIAIGDGYRCDSEDFPWVWDDLTKTFTFRALRRRYERLVYDLNGVEIVERQCVFKLTLHISGDIVFVAMDALIDRGESARDTVNIIEQLLTPPSIDFIERTPTKSAVTFKNLHPLQNIGDSKILMLELFRNIVVGYGLTEDDLKRCDYYNYFDFYEENGEKDDLTVLLKRGEELPWELASLGINFDLGETPYAYRHMSAYAVWYYLDYLMNIVELACNRKVLPAPRDSVVFKPYFNPQ